MTRRLLCPMTWLGDCPPPSQRRLDPSVKDEHHCARPPHHPAPCMCRCGARPAADGQEPLWGGAA